jgi:polysaccharide deacetylase family protein (PEP-CTERM system associated)
VSITNALTVDVEDYFHVSAFTDVISRESWDERESRVVRNTHAVLDLFEARDCRGTFFVLGWVAERFPDLVREIAARGHEVGCHGYSHRLIYRQSRDEFAAETSKAKDLLEQQIQARVLGYRAASFSITDASLWALDVLVECGFSYDSSFYPVHHDLYGTVVDDPAPHEITAPSGGRLVEFPMTAKSVAGLRVPASGGGYFRLYPYALSRALVRAVNADGLPVVFYMHPWEVDPGQPRIQASWKSRFRHYTNLRSCREKLNNLLTDFDFSSMNSILEGYDFAASRQKALASSS